MKGRGLEMVEGFASETGTICWWRVQGGGVGSGTVGGKVKDRET